MKGKIGTKILLISSLLWSVLFAQQEPCTVINSDSSLIVDIEESRGNQVTQDIIPTELEISGTTNDIELILVYTNETQEKYFDLEGKKLKLIQALDRDLDDISSLQLSVTCVVKSTGKRKTIPLYVRVSDINDNSPMFIDLPYVASIPEDTKVGSIVFDKFATKDLDSNVNGQVEYIIADPENEFFEIDLPHQGILTLKRELDYETQKIHRVQIIARDRATNPDQRLSASTTLTVNVIDSDDQSPRFIHDLYTSKIVSGINSGALEVSPEKIHAEDQDTLRSTIKYELISGSPPDFANFFQINFQNGVVTQIAPVSRTSAKEYNIIVRATEMPNVGKFAETNLVIKIKAEDLNPPVLSASDTIGYIEENSVVGTVVTNAKGDNISFSISDADHTPDDLPEYAYEITTTAFKIDDQNHLIVNQANLDRDPPNENRLSFQVFVRELVEDNPKSSKPLTITVNLKDVNDNAPILEAVPDISVVAGSTKRSIATLTATDKDGDTSLEYQILRVTNNGREKFKLNSATGRLDLVGSVQTGDHYALTVEVVDKRGKSSQGVIEIRVTPKPNRRGPIFTNRNRKYQTAISEDAAKFATVISIEAVDPEDDLVRYDIVGGNEFQHFLIEESTGEIRVNTSLDREQIENYILTVRASDNGGKSTNATVNIQILDVNDQTPKFVDVEPFRVVEGQSGALVGKVEAKDNDIGENAIVFYSIGNNDNLIESPPFEINEQNGEIKTIQDLDFETQNTWYLVVQARDKDALETATATVTVLVQDEQDEFPVFEQATYQSTVKENSESEFVTKVTAIDKDEVASVTYEIISGDRNLFEIDPKSGEIRTQKGLDYEIQRMHFLTISTEESRGIFNGKQTTCIVEITVEDQNDNTPIFSNGPTTLPVPNNVQIGSKIAVIKATDADGTAPGNIVNYEFIPERSNEKAETYFNLDRESGEITVINDLTKEVFDEYVLEIRAVDQGNPPLESSLTMIIRIQQVVTMPPELGIGFAQLEHELNLPENQPVQSVIHSISLDQVPHPGLKIQCEIIRVKDNLGNVRKGLFDGEFNNNQCHLILLKNLDKESDDSFEIMFKLKTQSAFTNPSKMISTIQINIEDINDNPPKFVFNNENENNYLITIGQSTAPGSGIIQIKANDRDSGQFGKILYEITRNVDNLFTIDSETGVVRTNDRLDGISSDRLPFKLLVTAFDAGGLKTTTELFVNLIRAEDGIVLVIENFPVSKLEPKRAELQSLLEEQTNFIVSIDYLVPSMVRFENDTCCKMNKDGTDVYFHVVNRTTGKVLPYQDEWVKRKITNERASTDLKYIVTSRLGVQATDIHVPYKDLPDGLPGSKGIGTLPINGPIKGGFDGLPAALIAIGCLVFALAFAAIIYLCIMKHKTVTEIEKQPKTIVIPRYQPVFVEPNLKEYETQVLQMSVPIDDTERMNFEYPPNRNLRYAPSFSIDNISYITKDRTGESLSTMKTSGEFESSKDLSHYSTLEGDLDDSFFSTNSERSPSNPNYLSASRTNENVIFGNGTNPEFVSSTPRRKKSSSSADVQSPIDSTTQL